VGRKAAGLGPNLVREKSGQEGYGSRVA